MARKKSRTFTEVELEFMQIIWKLGDASTEDIRDTLQKKGRDLTDGSVRKILSILVEKGHVQRRQEGRGFIYYAAVKMSDANSTMVRDLLTRVFGGSAALMVASLFESSHVSEEEIETITRLIANRKTEGRP